MAATGWPRADAPGSKRREIIAVKFQSRIRMGWKKLSTRQNAAQVAAPSPAPVPIQDVWEAAEAGALESWQQGTVPPTASSARGPNPSRPRQTTVSRKSNGRKDDDVSSEKNKNKTKRQEGMASSLFVSSLQPRPEGEGQLVAAAMSTRSEKGPQQNTLAKHSLSSLPHSPGLLVPADAHGLRKATSAGADVWAEPGLGPRLEQKRLVINWECDDDDDFSVGRGSPGSRGALGLGSARSTAAWPGLRPDSSGSGAGMVAPLANPAAGMERGQARLPGTSLAGRAGGGDGANAEQPRFEWGDAGEALALEVMSLKALPLASRAVALDSPTRAHVVTYQSPLQHLTSRDGLQRPVRKIPTRGARLLGASSDPHVSSYRRAAPGSPPSGATGAKAGRADAGAVVLTAQREQKPDAGDEGTAHKCGGVVQGHHSSRVSSPAEPAGSAGGSSSSSVDTSGLLHPRAGAGSEAQTSDEALGDLEAAREEAGPGRHVPRTFSASQAASVRKSGSTRGSRVPHSTPIPCASRRKSGGFSGSLSRRHPKRITSRHAGRSTFLKVVKNEGGAEKGADQQQDHLGLAGTVVMNPKYVAVRLPIRDALDVESSNHHAFARQAMSHRSSSSSGQFPLRSSSVASRPHVTLATPGLALPEGVSLAPVPPAGATAGASSGAQAPAGSTLDCVAESGADLERSLNEAQKGLLRPPAVVEHAECVPEALQRASELVSRSSPRPALPLAQSPGPAPPIAQLAGRGESSSG